MCMVIAIMMNINKYGKIRISFINYILKVSLLIKIKCDRLLITRFCWHLLKVILTNYKIELSAIETNGIQLVKIL